MSITVDASKVTEEWVADKIGKRSHVSPIDFALALDRHIAFFYPDVDDLGNTYAIRSRTKLGLSIARTRIKCVIARLGREAFPTDDAPASAQPTGAAPEGACA